ncbi:nucleotidyltransferase [bacterium]|nr:nucleotidyltransferase [bacterium]
MTKKQNTEKDFEELLSLFGKHNVTYCIVGAFAVAFHAIPRYTKDIDLFVEASTQNGDRIIKALKEFGFTPKNLSANDFATPGLILQMGYEPVRIDLLTKIDGCTFPTVWKNRKKGKYGKVPVHFIGLADLIKNKKASGRMQDKADLELLQKKTRKKK